MVEESPFGKRTNAKGFEGVIRFVQERKDLELKVLE
jgi:hypothetical protein